MIKFSKLTRPGFRDVFSFMAKGCVLLVKTQEKKRKKGSFIYYYKSYKLLFLAFNFADLFILQGLIVRVVATVDHLIISFMNTFLF